MKKYILAGAMFLSIFGIPLVHADVVPENQKMVTVCAEMKGIAALPKITVLAREGHVNQSAPTVWKVNEGNCVDLSYKFDILDLYAVDSVYAATLNLQTYDPANDSKAYNASLKVDVTDLFVDPASTLTYRHNEYVVAGVNNTNHQLVLLSAGYKTNLVDETATPNFPSGLSAAIGSQVDVSGPGLQTNVFTDVTSDSPYYNALIYLKTAGVISGYADGSFKPNNLINRAEFTKILVGASPDYVNNGLCLETYAKPDGSGYYDIFTDVLTASDAWYLEPICYAKTSHFIDGYPDGSFKPAQNINFAEAAKIIANAFQLTSSTTAASTPWYKVYVDALAIKNAIPTTITTFDQSITRGEMAEMAFRMKSQNTTLSSQTYDDLASFVLYTNSAYGFELITSQSCKNQFKITTEAGAGAGGGLGLTVYVPLSKSWSADSAWYYYSVMTQQQYDQIPTDELPGKPNIVLNLNNNMLLTVAPPQDSPGDINNCGITSRKLV